MSTFQTHVRRWRPLTLTAVALCLAGLAILTTSDATSTWEIAGFHARRNIVGALIGCFGGFLIQCDLFLAMPAGGRHRWVFAGTAAFMLVPLALNVSNLIAFHRLLRAGLPVRANPFMAAAERGDVEEMKQRLDAGQDVHFTETSGMNALMLACGGVPRKGRDAGTPAAVRFLLDRGIGARDANRGGFTALHYAVGNGCLECAALLVEHGADVNAIAEHRQSPLFWAVFQKREASVRWLLEHGADYTLHDSNGKTALDHTTEPALRSLLEH